MRSETLVGHAVVVRDAVEADADQIAAIWNHEVLWTDATTDTETRDGRAQRERLARRTAAAPVIVAVAGKEVLAYGALGPYRPKPAFAWTVEDSVYVKRRHHGAGLGTLILGELIERARGAAATRSWRASRRGTPPRSACTSATGSRGWASSARPPSSSAAGTT